MKKILIPNINNKFYNNLLLTQLPNINISSAHINGNIYNIYYQINFDVLIIPYSQIDNSIIQFAIEFRNTKIIIDLNIDNIDLNFIDTYKSVFTFITKNNKHIFNKVIKIPYNIINDEFYKINLPKPNKKPYIACFLDELAELPKELEQHLYPNAKHRIRMFNNPNITHIQNLGQLNEIDKAKVLMEAKGYLDLNNLYLNEAILCGCEIFSIQSLSEMIPEKINVQDYSTYKELIQKITS